MTIREILKGGEGIPKVIFNEKKNLLTIEGVCMPEDATTMFKDLFEFIDNKEEKHISINLKIKYLNSMANKEMLRLLFDIFENYDQVYINWHYKKEDDLMKLKGEEFRDILEIEDFILSEY